MGTTRKAMETLFGGEINAEGARQSSSSCHWYLDRTSYALALPRLFVTTDQTRGAIMLGFSKGLMKNGGEKSFEGFRRGVEGV